MPTKYDTNPLDPDFPEKAKAAAEAAGSTQALPYSGAATQHFPPTAQTEEQTRRFATADRPVYTAPYSGQYVPAQYQHAGFAVDHSKTRKVAKIGLPENIATAVPYFPFYLGIVASVLMLLFLPKSETKVRFHAAQGLSIHIAILIVSGILSSIGNITGVARAGSIIFQIAMLVMLIIWSVKAWKGKPVHIETVDPLTNWFEEKIKMK